MRIWYTEYYRYEKHIEKRMLVVLLQNKRMTCAVKDDQTMQILKTKPSSYSIRATITMLSLNGDLYDGVMALSYVMAP